MARIDRLAPVLLLAATAHAQQLPCSACPATPPASQQLLTCRSSGDPHYVTWDGTRYDFMGLGAFRLFKGTTSCGCAVEVQTMMCGCSGGSGCAPGASANSAAAIQVDNVNMVFMSDMTVSVTRPGFGTTTVQPGATFAPIGSLTLTVHTFRGSTGWKVGIPGGGELLLYAATMSAMPNSRSVQVWFNMPSDTCTGDISGLCAQPCYNLPPVPYPWCATPEEERCLPVKDVESIFPMMQRMMVEGQCQLSTSVRSTSTACIDNSCGTITANATFDGGVVVAGVDGGVPVSQATSPLSYGYLITDPETCLEFCRLASPAASYMTFTPSTTYQSGTFSYTDPGGCYCRSFGIASPPNPMISSSRGRVCRPECLADEASRVWVNQRREVTNGFEMNVDYALNDVQRFYNVPNANICQKKCAAVDNAVVFTWSRCGNLCYCKSSDAGRRMHPCGISGVVCTQDSLCLADSLGTSSTPGTWYNVVGNGGVVEYGPSGQAVGDCINWCEDLGTEFCSIRNALLSGGQMRCGFDASRGQCAVFAAANIATKLVSGQAVTQRVSTADCNVDLRNLTACAVTPHTACEASGITMQQVEAMCTLSPPLGDDFYHECIFDCCATGGHPSCVNATKDASDDNGEICQYRPPALPPPAAPPPDTNFLDFLDYYCNVCHGTPSLLTAPRRRLAETSISPEQQERIRVRVEAYMQGGMEKHDAWSLVREENDALIANQTGI